MNDEYTILFGGVAILAGLFAAYAVGKQSDRKDRDLLNRLSTRDEELINFYKQQLNSLQSTINDNITYVASQQVLLIAKKIRSQVNWKQYFPNGFTFKDFMEIIVTKKHAFVEACKCMLPKYTLLGGNDYRFMFDIAMQELCDEGKWMVKYDENNNNLIYYPIYNQKSIDNI